MNRVWLSLSLGIVLGLVGFGCGQDRPDPGLSGSRPTLTRSSPLSSAETAPETLPDPPQDDNLPGSIAPEVTETAPPPADPTPVSQSNPPDLERDYAPDAPISATGQVTIRGDIRNLEDSRLIADCPTDTAAYAFAESTNYFIQICSAEYDPWLPKYYIGRAREGGGELRLTNDDPETASQLIFKNGPYAYILYRDSARLDATNAYLEVYTPDGQGFAEALLYFYERVDRPTP